MDKHHKINIEYAKKLGLKPALIYQYVKDMNAVTKLQAIIEEFPYLSSEDVGNSIQSLVEQGLIEFDETNQIITLSTTIKKTKIRTPNNNRSNKIDKFWSPSEDAIEVLQRAGVDAEFINGLLDEFIIYWSEKSSALVSYNSKFIEYCRLKWAQHTAEIDTKSVPKIIDKNWKPSEDCLDIIKMTGIDDDFVQLHLPEFILYWKEDGRAFVSWDIKFLDFIKNKWNYNVEVTSKEHTYKFDLFDPYAKDENKSKKLAKGNIKELRKKYKI